MYTHTTHTLIKHTFLKWNGKSWRQASIPNFPERGYKTKESAFHTELGKSLNLPSRSTKPWVQQKWGGQGLRYFRLASICNQGALCKAGAPCLCTGGVCSSICAALPALRELLFFSLVNWSHCRDRAQLSDPKELPSPQNRPFNTHSCSRRNPAFPTVWPSQ